VTVSAEWWYQINMELTNCWSSMLLFLSIQHASLHAKRYPALQFHGAIHCIQFVYLGDHPSNHKEFVAIMRILEDVMGINRRTLVAFYPGMRGAQEKLQWASMRVTTLPEDITYSLFGIFGVHLSPICGENK
jgi:hypothetical protein